MIAYLPDTGKISREGGKSGKEATSKLKRICPQSNIRHSDVGSGFHNYTLF